VLLATIAGAFVCSLGAVVLFGWMFGIASLTYIVPSWPRMIALTAFGFVTLGSALALAAQHFESARAPHWLASLTILIGLSGLAAHATGYTIDLDRFAVESLRADSIATMTMSPATATSLMLMGIALLFARARKPIVLSTLALISLMSGWLGIARYLYGGIPLFPYTAMAIHTAINITVASIGLLALRPEFGIAAIFSRSRLGSATARRIIPAAVLIPLFAGAAAAYAVRMTWVGAESALAMFALCVTVTFVTITWIDALALARADRQRLAAQEALGNRDAQMRTLTEQLPHLVWTCRPDGWCDYLSSQWLAYTGVPIEQQLGYGWNDQLHPDDRERVQREWIAATTRGDFFDVEFRIRRADGAYRWFKTRAVPFRDAHGAIIKWFGSNTDFQELKLSQERLMVQLERLNLLDQTVRALAKQQDLDSILDSVLRHVEEQLPLDFGAVLLLDDDRQSLYVAAIGPKSRPFATHMQLQTNAQLGIEENHFRTCLEGQLIYEPDTANVASAFTKRFTDAGLLTLALAPLNVDATAAGIFIAARRDRDSFTSADCEFLRLLSQHVALAGRQARLLADLERAYNEIRQTQSAVMQQERLRALGQMSSGIAHDLNNAMSPAMLYVQLLLEHELNLSDHAKKLLASIQHSIQDIAQTVARMREFYRPNERQQELLPVDLGKVIARVVDLTRARWQDMPQERGIVINVITDIDEMLPPVMGVESEIKDALVNLVLNAVDAMPHGGTLTLQAGRVTDSTTQLDNIRVEVRDTGIGMDELAKQRCLEPFFTTKGDRGTGLGLAMVYGTMQRHEGTIDVDSTPGVGTTMRLSFPIQPAMSPMPTTTRAPAFSRVRPLRILLVDDDPLILQALQSALRSDGHDVTTAEGGQVGIAAFQSSVNSGSAFDVVFTDLGMPYVDGRQVAQAVKVSCPTTPVILMTGWGTRLRYEEDRPIHVDVVLSKPPSLSKVRNVLAEIVKIPDEVS